MDSLSDNLNNYLGYFVFGAEHPFGSEIHNILDMIKYISLFLDDFGRLNDHYLEKSLEDNHSDVDDDLKIALKSFDLSNQ